MSLDARSPPPDSELLRLMLEVPYLIRRPIIRISGQAVFGFDKKRLEKTLGAGG